MIILLNGTSASGKTAVARALQASLEGPWLRYGIDLFHQALPADYLAYDPSANALARQGLYATRSIRDGEPWIDSGAGPLGQQWLSDMRHVVALLAARGNNLIVDDILAQDPWLIEYLRVLEPFDVLFAGIRCALEVAQARECERGARYVGRARAQFEQVHRNRQYDVEVDSSALTPDQCAQIIVSRLLSGAPLTAFRELRTRHRLSPGGATL